MGDTLALDAKTSAILDVWLSGQTLLPQVRRWGENTDAKGRGRRQDVLQHTVSVSVLGRIFKGLLEPHLIGKATVSWLLIFDALLFHDHGEEVYISRGYDENSEERTIVDGELLEDAAFARRCGQLPTELARSFVYSSRLQFAPRGKNFDGDIPADLFEDQSAHRSAHWQEALIFEAIERYDYLLYAFEHRHDTEIAVAIIRRHLERLSYLADRIPGMREELWTRELGAACITFIAAHDDISSTTAADLIG
ncbi:hypothetical protein HY627_01500 [Candidatus Uhrbacteria bacterium]|nr:hypothetical protein [Candidatus Uhrbacteria bacterium]